MVRIKHRYLLANILFPAPGAGTTASTSETPYSVQFRRPTPESFTSQALLRLIRDSIVELFGDYGSGKVSASLVIKYFSSATSTAIIRVAREHYRLVWAALTFITKLSLSKKPADDAMCVVQVVRVSGTIRKAEEEAIKRARLASLRARKGTSSSRLNGSAERGPTAGWDGDEDEDVSMAGGVEDDDIAEDDGSE